MSSGSEKEQAPSPKELQASLEQVIGVLESDQQRTALLKQLKQLRQASQEAAAENGGSEGGGLLGALASSLESGEGQNNGKALLAIWRDRAGAAWQDLQEDFGNTRQWWLGVRDFGLTLLAWAGMATLFYFMLRRVLYHYGLRLELTDQPTALTMLRYCLRRVVPWAVAFGLTLTRYFLAGELVRHRAGTDPGIRHGLWDDLRLGVRGSVCPVHLGAPARGPAYPAASGRLAAVCHRRACGTGRCHQFCDHYTYPG
ncbi:hypothetical protein BH688_16020 [Kushneria phosphatilytica]|nr:hypothetical protein BH688_16020 [Kushneria phosphatilytica]